MIKNEYCCTNEELASVKRDLRNNKEFGSLFQFWVSQVLSELENDESEGDLHKLAIKIVNRFR